MVREQNLIIESLLLKLARGEVLTGKEMHTLEQWLKQRGEVRLITELVKDEKWLWRTMRQLGCGPSPHGWDRLEQRLAMREDPLPLMKFDWGRVRRWTVAAGLAGLLMLNGINRDRQAVTTKAFHVKPIEAGFNPILKPAPIGETAEVITRDGGIILLDTVPENGIVTTNGKAILRKVNQNTLQCEGQPSGSMVYCLSTGNIRGYTLLFADHSRVYLKKNSSLWYSPAMRKSTQPLILNGEAFFSISKNSSSGLTVVDNGTIVQVLGTDFHVSGYAGDSTTRVYVYRGAVKVHHRGDSTALECQEGVEVRKDSMFAKRTWDTASMLAWTDIGPKFHFNNCSLQDAIQQIADYYHLEVQNPSGLKGIPIILEPMRGPLNILLRKIEKIENNSISLTLNSKGILINPCRH